MSPKFFFPLHPRALINGTIRRPPYRAYNDVSYRPSSVVSDVNSTSVSGIGHLPTEKWPLKRLQPSTIIRTIFLSQILSSPWLSKLGMGMLKRIAHSRQPILDPDRNPVLSRVLRACIYNQFCAGATKPEIVKGIAEIKQVGHAGVILNYAREVIHHELAEADPETDISAAQIQHWLDGNLSSLSMLGPRDYLGLKYTGTGGQVASALTNGEDPSPQFSEALDKICVQAQKQGTRILLDAEQVIYQPTIDRWTLNIMRKYNKTDPLILNTYQAYLKTTRVNIRNHLKIAAKEGWHMGIKLVRGAYIINERRELIHDTKADTDRNYDTIAHDLLHRDFDGLSGSNFPWLKLFLAGHNASSIRRAAALHRELVFTGRKPGALEFGQLWGMADHISGQLVARGEAARNNTHGLSGKKLELEREAAPHVYKCVNWGTVRDCIHFLMRRAAENAGSTDRLHDGLKAAKTELRARIFGRWD